jgi:hypothetical protein
MAIEENERRGPREEANERGFRSECRENKNLLLLLLLSTCIHTSVGRFLDFQQVQVRLYIRLSSTVVWSGQVILLTSRQQLCNNQIS